MKVYLSHGEGPGGMVVTGLADSDDFMVNSNGAQMEPNGGHMEPNGAQREFKWSTTESLENMSWLGDIRYIRYII